jgi:hypothetical protein
MTHKDKLPGGLADKKTPEDFNRQALQQGQKVELEHTSDARLAKEIAMDHLTEDPTYYKKLRTIEKHALHVYAKELLARGAVGVYSADEGDHGNR